MVKVIIKSFVITHDYERHIQIIMLEVLQLSVTICLRTDLFPTQRVT